MNKLYKYLPFNINCISKKYFDYTDLEGNLVGVLYEKDGRINALITKEDDTFEVLEKDVKPILRPFEHLTKELPLTKAAAEMIGMEEGMLVNPLEFMFRYNNNITGYEYMNVNAIKHNNGFTIDLNDQTENLKIEVDIELDSNFNFSINHFVWQKKEKYRVANSYYTINLDCLDFLRALHFAVDFKKDEYIKLEE
jgi:hypothetical protein